MPSRVTLRRKSRAAQQQEADGLDSGQTELPRGEGHHAAVAGDAEMQAQAEYASEEDAALEPVASTSSPVPLLPPPSKPSFVLVMDNGQLSLVPASKSHAYRSLPKPGQTADDESGASTPTLKHRKKSKGLLRGSFDAPSPRVRVVPVKRGRGRPPKKRSRSRMLEFELEEDDEQQGDDVGEESDGEDVVGGDGEEGEAGTPAEETELPASDEAGESEDDIVPPASEQNVFVQGRDYLLRNDELVLDTDEDGDKKVDEKGNLLGDRKYIFKTFSSPFRADKETQYAMSIDVARAAGYRDTLYFFRRNPLLIKLSCTEREKSMLIEENRLSGQLRTRNVTMLAVRNVFKLHGAKVVQDGRQIIDEYYEKEAIESGKKEGQSAQQDEEAATPVVAKAAERRREADRERDRMKRRPDAFTFSTADLNGNAVYTTFGDAGLSPFERAKGWNARRVNLQKAELDEENWMMEMARSVRGMNRELIASRTERLKAFPRPYESMEDVTSSNQAASTSLNANTEDSIAGGNTIEDLPIGFYEPTTNMPHYSSRTQARWAGLERVGERPLLNSLSSPKDSTDGLAILGNAKVGSHGWGLASFDQVVKLPQPRSASVIIPAGSSAKEKE